VAGGAALNEVLGASRRSKDLDLFHDTEEALAASWESDRELLVSGGYEVSPIRERPAFVEALIRRAGDQVIVQWTRDSAYRFFPLMEHPDFGLTLHPFDLGTNKVLALAGRLEPRDWIDVIHSCRLIQPLGFLIWAASGKDPGLSPALVLAEAGRARYSSPEIDELAFDGPRPEAGALSREWAGMVKEAAPVIDLLPAETVGTCVLERAGALFRGSVEALRASLAGNRVIFHSGTIRGAFPRIIG